jgi:hypothetical protein
MVKKINKNKNAYVRIWDFCVLGFLLRGLNWRVIYMWGERSMNNKEVKTKDGLIVWIVSTEDFKVLISEFLTAQSLVSDLSFHFYWYWICWIGSLSCLMSFGLYFAILFHKWRYMLLVLISVLMDFFVFCSNQ